MRFEDILGDVEELFAHRRQEGTESDGSAADNKAAFHLSFLAVNRGFVGIRELCADHLRWRYVKAPWAEELGKTGL